MFSSPPPLAPPTTEEDTLRWLCLIRSSRVGVSTFFRLMNEHGSAQAALEALPDVAQASGVKNYRACPAGVVHAEIAAGRKTGAKLIAYGAPEYPSALMNIPDPPPLIWAKGDPAYLNTPTVALIGARNGSSLGLRMTKSLAKGLGEAGYTIASGLARGIDTAAHKTALETGTIAVMAGGVDVVYPPENAELADDIATNGIIISEQPIGLAPQARHFPRRNRIVSGLSRAVVVVEAAAKSGSLITAKLALDQGREVMAVPGHPFDARASGCNMLIRDGATLIRGSQDVLDAVGTTPIAKAAPKKSTKKPSAPSPTVVPPASDVSTAILSLLGPSPVAEDQLIRDLDVPAHVAAEELLTLELDGKIERRAGGLLALTA